MFIYKVYGLIIQSDIFMKELTLFNGTDKADVVISYGNASKKIDNQEVNEDYIKFSKNEFYMHIKGTSHYYVAYGNKIIVELEENCNIEDVKIFLLGTCLGILLAQRDIVAIHGGAVIINGKGIIVTGHSGAGKSTLTTALRMEGYEFLSDDVSALKNHINGHVLIYPTYAQQKLCKDAIEKLGYNYKNFILIDKSRDKYAIPLQESFSKYPVPLKAIYEINIGEDENVSIEKLSGMNKINTILKNIYRVEIISCPNFQPKYFKECIEIGKNIEVYKLNRPKGKFSVDRQVKLIKSSLGI
ncbi:MAG: hypothetical protein ABRQ25_04835 [Clostridiaceae bacterium]